MTLERRNPLPPGRYWMNLLGERSPEFTAGVKGLNESHPGLVKVLTTSHHEADESGNSEPAYDWVLFVVGGNGAVWDHDKIGTPNIAGPEITQESDTVQRPAPEKEVLDQIGDALPKPGDVTRTLTNLATAAVALFLLIQILKSKKRGQ